MQQKFLPYNQGHTVHTFKGLVSIDESASIRVVFNIQYLPIIGTKKSCMTKLQINGDKPNFLGIGAQKCASTWVHQVLEDHPQVRVPTLKELNFFSYYYNHGFQWYERHFGESESCLFRGKTSPLLGRDSLSWQTWQYARGTRRPIIPIASLS